MFAAHRWKDICFDTLALHEKRKIIFVFGGYDYGKHAAINRDSVTVTELQSVKLSERVVLW